MGTPPDETPKSERAYPQMDHFRKFNQIVAAVSQAMREGRIGFSLQQINAVRNPADVLYCECLGRLVEPNGAIRTSGEFIAFLEASGRVAAFDRHMIGLAFEWLDCHPSRVLGCNISAENVSDEDTWTELYELLSRNRKLAARLVLEITESLPIATLSMAAEFVQSARDLGYRIALDDFGTGHSTPESLLSIPVDIVKLDAFFIGHGRKEGKAFLHHMVGLASCVAPTVVVEGIETYAQLEAAKRAGATHVQGFLLSEPTLAPVHRGKPVAHLKAIPQTAGHQQMWN